MADPPSIVAIPTPTPRLTQSLSQHECEEHRARLAIEVEVVLDGYWQNRPGPQMKAAILADWMDELEDWPVDDVRNALRQWRRENPSRKPNPGHIAGLLKKQRGEAWAASQKKQPEPTRNEPTAEERERMGKYLAQNFPGAIKRIG